MQALNVNLPAHFYAYVRAEYCHGLDPAYVGRHYACAVFGACSVPHRALTFHVLLQSGAQWARIPLHALCHRTDAPARPITELQRWDCFGYALTVIRYDALREMTARVHRGGEAWEPGRYVCTFDWIENGYSDTPDQHKCLHLLALDDGNYGLEPNNYLRWHEASFTDNTAPLPRYRVNEAVWYAEE